MILIDGGDFSPPATEPNKIKARLIRELMDRMGYDIYGLGEREINYGYDFYTSLMEATQMEVVAGNVTYGPGEKRLGREYLVVDIGGVKVGFLHVFLEQGTTGKRNALRDNDYNVEDPVKSVTKTLAKVRKKSDFVVLLGHAPWGRLDEFLKEVSGFDFVLSAHDGGIDRKVRELHGTKLLRPGRRGQYVIKMEVVIDPEGVVKSIDAEAIAVKTSLPEDPEVAAMIKDATDNYNKMRRAQTVSHTQAQSEKLRGDKYLGDGICRRCHDDVYRAWVDTPHAAAFERLADKSREGDSDCVGCHTTGHGEPTGYLPPATESTPDAGAVQATAGLPGLKNVQCEACHGMGTYHDRVGGDFLKVSEADCSKCHSDEHSPEFNYKDYLPFVSCTKLVHDSE